MILIYRISAYSFHGNYSFFWKWKMWKFSYFLLHKLNSCRGNYWWGKLFKGGNYSRKYGKFETILHFVLTLLSIVKKVEDCLKFCGFFTISELYQKTGQNWNKLKKLLCPNLSRFLQKKYFIQILSWFYLDKIES